MSGFMVGPAERRDVTKKLHEKSQYHHKNMTNGWKDDREKKAQEELSQLLVECKRFYQEWKNDLAKERDLAGN